MEFIWSLATTFSNYDGSRQAGPGCHRVRVRVEVGKSSCGAGAVLSCLYLVDHLKIKSQSGHGIQATHLPLTGSSVPDLLHNTHIQQQG